MGKVIPIVLMILLVTALVVEIWDDVFRSSQYMLSILSKEPNLPHATPEPCNPYVYNPPDEIIVTAAKAMENRLAYDEMDVENYYARLNGGVTCYTTDDLFDLEQASTYLQEWASTYQGQESTLAEIPVGEQKSVSWQWSQPSVIQGKQDTYLATFIQVAENKYVLIVYSRTYKVDDRQTLDRLSRRSRPVIKPTW